MARPKIKAHEPLCLSVIAEDSDGDGMPNDWEIANGLNRLLNDAFGDLDSDGLTNLEEYQHGTKPNSFDTDGDNLPDRWEITYGLNPLSSNGDDGAGGDIEVDAITPPQMNSIASYSMTSATQKGDGVANRNEFLNGTDPTKTDTDGDGTSDADEIAQASDPTNAADGGQKPVDPIKEVEFNVGGDYASWRMEIKSLGPRDTRTLLVTSPAPDQWETKSHKLWKNNKYEITMHHTGSRPQDAPPWYCWEGQIDGKPNTATFNKLSDYQIGERNTNGNFFVVKDHWLVDNREGLLTTHLDSKGVNHATGKKAFLVPIFISDDLFATGVDNLSITALPDCAGYQSKFWIMAPTGGASNNTPSENNMKFWIPIDPPANLDITCPNAQVAPSTVTLGATPVAATWHGTSAITSANTPVFKIGQDLVDLPIGVYCMKKRTLKLALHKVYGIDKFGNITTPSLFPSENALESYLNKVYGLQTNAIFDVTIFEENGENQNGIDFDELDSKDDGILRVNANPDLTNATPNAQSISASAVANFDVWVVGGVQLNSYATAILGHNFGHTMIIDGDMLNSDKTLDQKNKQVLHTIAHEL